MKHLLSSFLFLLTLLLPAAAEETAKNPEGIRETWGETCLILKEPVVSRSVVENGRRLLNIEMYERHTQEQASSRPSAADCGLNLFTVSSNPAGEPAPKLRWTDQNKLLIEFAPGSSPDTEYRLVFNPGTTYLGGAPLATPAFSFRCKPAEFSASWLPEHRGGAALLTAISSTTREAQELSAKHEGLRVCFRRMIHVPLVGWVCSGTVPATLRPATVADGFGRRSRVLNALTERMNSEDIREDTPLPQSLIALPQRPLVPGARYELGVEAAEGSGFKSENLGLGDLPEALTATLERKLVQEEGHAPVTRLSLSFSQPVPEEQLRSLWAEMGVSADNTPATRQEDGSYRMELPQQGEQPPFVATLRLKELIPCNPLMSYWRGNKKYSYAPKGCALGLEMELQSEHPLELHLSLPTEVQTRHGLALRKDTTLSASISPAAPALAGDGGNTLAFSGSHLLQLPIINVGELRATAYHWDAETAARLLPVIQHGLRDDTIACELWQRLAWMRRRAEENLSTEGWQGEDARSEAGRALKLLKKEYAACAPLREKALAAATAFGTQALAVNGTDNGNGLLEQGWAALDLDKLTGGQTRPGLYLVSLSYRPTADVLQALAAFGMKEDDPATTCTVDFLVQVTDMCLRWGEDRLLVNSLATGQALEGAELRLYALPNGYSGADEEKRLAAAAQEAVLAANAPTLAVKQGEAVLPEKANDKLLLVQRGEDYALLSLWNNEVESVRGDEPREPMLELFSDRPLYRPGDVAHLRGVLRRPVRGGLALPRAQRGTLVIHKPNGEVMETRPVTIDAYGALAEDVALPKGEEDVAGQYRCLLRVEESGKAVEAELNLSCEVFRRDAFKAELSIELDPVAPQEYKVAVQATDYNGTPLVGGKVELKLSSTAPLLDAEGRKPKGLKETSPNELTPRFFNEFSRALVLDAAGRAEVRGRFGSFEESIILNASGSVSNDREEYVRLPRQWKTASSADFTISVDHETRLHLSDARKEKHTALGREQELEMRLIIKEEQRRELPSGIWYSEEVEREVACHRITVPANCKQGLELSPYWEGTEWYRKRPSLRLHFSGRDPEGRLIREQHRVSFWQRSSDDSCSLTPEERSLRMEVAEAFKESGELHAYIGSQGQRRHTLVSVRAGENSLSIPLQAQEYGEVQVTLIRCEKGKSGLYTEWKTQEACCTLPRPDKELKLEFSLPAGAKPGDKVALSGRVLGADGKPVKAAITLFAVDAGMMSVAPYELPELAASFYQGVAPSFSLSDAGRSGAQRSSELLVLPNVWSLRGGSWSAAAQHAGWRSVLPQGMNVGAFSFGEVGGIFRWGMSEAVRAARPNFRWSELFELWEQQQPEYMPAPAPVVVVAESADGSNAVKKSKRALQTYGLRSGSVDEEDEEGAMEESLGDGLGEADAGPGKGYRAHALAGAMPEPRLRKNFEPVALWLASLESAADGSFATECTLPDTLTTYKVYAVALDAGGGCFGKAEGEFLVNQELMLTAGTPFFMSTGDRLLLPLTITNNREEAGEWMVTLSGAGEVAPQQVKLAGRETATLYFEVQGGEEGMCVLRWTARSADGADAVEGSFPLRYPAPLLKEAHRLVLAEGSEAVATGSLLAPEVAEATRGEVEVQYSTSPLIHLAGSVDFLLSYPYGCTEQRASALLPWIYYEQLAPFCPQMAMTSAAEAKATVERSISQLLARQQKDGGLSYWSVPKGEPAVSCAWASAYAGLVLTLAKEQGFAVPEEALEKLRDYLGRHNRYKGHYLTQYAVARTRGRNGEVNRILVKALRKELKLAEYRGWERNTEDLTFMADLRSNPNGRHGALLTWLRSKGKDYRHRSSWNGGWTLIALSEYLKLEPKAAGNGSIRINGEEHEAANKPGTWRVKVAEGQRVSDIMPAVAAGKGSVYAAVKVKAQPEQTDYPGVTEKGLQVTRVYEVKGADGQWRESTSFKVGDVVRVTLTCAKIADELEYFVLEDYLPACMEAINPNVPGQAVGLECGGRGRWSEYFDHKEYLADRVRGFCTRWAGRDLVNMSYYARVKRAGESMAPPASAQLMYEPQTYGLSPNARITSSSAQAE